jgi:hypothetical protein
MEATVPICRSVVVRRILPLLSSVRNAVPAPVTAVLPCGTEIVPERRVFGQAVASQVPVATLVMFRLTALAGAAGKAANSIIMIVRMAAVLYIKDLVLVFAFIVLLGYDGGWRMDSSPAMRFQENWTYFLLNCF